MPRGMGRRCGASAGRVGLSRGRAFCGPLGVGELPEARDTGRGGGWLSGCASGSSLARDGWTRAPRRQESASLRGRLLARLLFGASGLFRAGSPPARSSIRFSTAATRPAASAGGVKNIIEAVRSPSAVVSPMWTLQGVGHFRPAPGPEAAKPGKRGLGRKLGRGTRIEVVVVVGRMDAFSARTGSAGAARGGQPRPATAGSRRPRWTGGGEPPGLRPGARGARLLGSVAGCGARRPPPEANGPKGAGARQRRAEWGGVPRTVAGSGGAGWAAGATRGRKGPTTARGAVRASCAAARWL